jgi:hypothetical protein
MSPCFSDEWRLVVEELDAGLAAPWATHGWCGVTQSSFPRLLAGAFVVKARRLDESVERPWRVGNVVEAGGVVERRVGKACGAVERANGVVAIGKFSEKPRQSGCLNTSITVLI